MSYKDAEIIVGNGAGQLIFSALFSTINPGDEVIIPVPYWDNYPDMVRMAQGVPILVATDPDYKLDVDAIACAITPRTKWLILNNPANPSGAIVGSGTLRRLSGLLRTAPAERIAVLADQCFEQLCFDQEPPESFATLPGMFERTLVVNGLSKPYAMTGWRIGYAAGPLPLIEHMSLVAANTTFSVCSVAQAAAIAALDVDKQAPGAYLLENLRASRHEACNALLRVPKVKFKIPAAG